jgi:hypothetical protein
MSKLLKKNILAIITLLLLLVLIACLRHQNIESKTSTISSNKDEIKSILNFSSIPNEWFVKEQSYSYDVMSPEYRQDAAGFMTDGIKFSINKEGALTDKSLKQYALDSVPLDVRSQYNIVKNLKVDNREFVSIFFCYEGCMERYFFKYDNKIYSINYSCNCQSENESRITYMNDADNFFENLKFYSDYYKQNLEN